MKASVTIESEKDNHETREATSDSCWKKSGAGEGTRTPDHRVNSPALYLAELPRHPSPGAGSIPLFKCVMGVLGVFRLLKA